MEEKSIDKRQIESLTEKKVYTPPTLTIYGKLTELTASGTANASENDMSTPPRVGPLFMA